MTKSTPKTPFTKKIIENNDGIATILVLSAISLLTFVIYDFTFDVKLNNLKMANQQNKQQARLNAEAGISFAIAKLKIYREALNLLEKDKKLKDLISPNKVEALITSPFVYPIPLPNSANLIQKNALKEFEKNSLMVGGLNVEISPISGFLNVNNLRIKKADESEENPKNNTSSAYDDEIKSIHAYVEEELVNTVRETIEKKKEDDEFFEAMYGELDANILINELKFYVNDKGTLEDASEAEQLYDSNDILPKHAPLTSASELYLLEGWDDTIVDLIKPKISVHEVAIIPLNEITSGQLKILFPKINDDQIKDFYKHRDGTQDSENTNDEDNEPHPFESVEDFKNLIVDQLGIVETSEFEDRVEALEKAGLKLGIAGKLFKIISRGTYDNSTYTLMAFVDLPIKPQPTPTPTPAPKPEKPGSTKPTTTSPNPDNKNKKKTPRILLEPRIIEIYSN